MTDLHTLATQTTILVVIPDQALRAQVLAALALVGTTIIAENTFEAEGMLRQEEFGLLIVQDDQAAETGVMFLARINNRHPWMRRILICHRVESDLLIYMINEANVFRCATLPLDPAAFRRLAIGAAEDHARLRHLADAAADGERWRAERKQASVLNALMPTPVRQWIGSLPGAFSRALMTSLWALFLGAVVLLILYVLKTALAST